MCDIRINSGRKKESCVWRYFDYCDVKDKSRCKVMDENGKQCTVELSGKNATNLKAHLSRFHKQESQLVDAQDTERETSKQPITIIEPMVAKPKQSTLTTCFSKVTYAVDSVEYNVLRVVAIFFLSITDVNISVFEVAIIGHKAIQQYDNSVLVMYYLYHFVFW